MSSNAHVPVLLGPVLKGLNINDNGVYVDATFGRGGHSIAILNQLGNAGRLIAIDRDPQAIEHAPAVLTGDSRFELVRGEYAQLESIIKKRNLGRMLDGILFDVGVSSPQLDEADRGFSFRRDGPLDMRMDPDHGISAAEWLAKVSESDLRRTLRQFGEENMAPRIARAIVAAREDRPITRTVQLADIVLSAVPAKFRSQRIHPATKTFQAIRILINEELEQLASALEQSVRLLGKRGRLCVISFHSLEDRIVKRFMRDQSRVSEQYRGMPFIPDEFQPALRAVGKPQTADDQEIAANVRARSARLRIAERVS